MSKTSDVYDENYFNGKNSFFWKAGYGGYGWFSRRYFDNLFTPLKPFLKTSGKMRVLDIGCAYGFMLERFPAHFVKYGTDVSRYAIDIAKKRLKKGTFIVADIEKKAPFPKNSFDYIVCNDVIEHLNNPKRALIHMCEMLKPNGILYLTTPNRNEIRKRLFWYADKQEHHISLFTHQTLQNTLTDIGFTPLKQWTYTHFFVYVPTNKHLGIESGVIAQKKSR